MLLGQVIKAGSDKRSGNYVILRHGDFTVSYCHLSKCYVKRGDCVRPGGRSRCMRQYGTVNRAASALDGPNGT